MYAEKQKNPVDYLFFFLRGVADRQNWFTNIPFWVQLQQRK